MAGMKKSLALPAIAVGGALLLNGCASNETVETAAADAREAKRMAEQANTTANGLKAKVDEALRTASAASATADEALKKAVSNEEPGK